MNDDHHDSGPEAYKGAGTGLTEGSLVRLSKACMIGRKHFGNAWPISFKNALLHGTDHLSFLEELFWLDRWHHVTDIKHEAAPYKSEGFTPGTILLTTIIFERWLGFAINIFIFKHGASAFPMQSLKQLPTASYSSLKFYKSQADITPCGTLKTIASRQANQP